MTREDLDFIGAMNMCDDISNDAYKKIVCHCEGQEPILDKIRDEIEMYELDCRLQGGAHECEKCNDNVFGSIYRIIDKYKAESEE